SNVPTDIWSINSNIIACEIIINLVYFDGYYLFKVIRTMLRGEKFTRSELAIFLPLIWTMSGALMYISGTEMYVGNAANFYSNAYWNLASVIYPILSVQSCVSTEMAKYYESTKAKTVKNINTKSIAVSKAASD
ncbi:hypothetical protein HK103_004299, partial [Boothiomyces macroporosus]